MGARLPASPRSGFALLRTGRRQLSLCAQRPAFDLRPNHLSRTPPFLLPASVAGAGIVAAIPMIRRSRGADCRKQLLLLLWRQTGSAALGNASTDLS